MVTRKPNESFRIFFRSKIKGIAPSAFTVLCEKTDDLTVVPLQDISVKEVKRSAQVTGDYYVGEFNFAGEGEYLLTIASETNSLLLKTIVSIKEQQMASSTEEHVGIIY